MMRFGFLLAAAALVAMVPSVAAQTVTLPQVSNAGGAKVPSQGVVSIDSSGAELGSLSLAAATLTAASSSGVGADQAKHQAKGMLLAINVTALSGSGASVTVTLQGKDSVSGQYYTILTSPAIVATGTTVLRVYPGLTASANAVASDVLPPVWRVTYAIAGTTPSVTATVGANLIP